MVNIDIKTKIQNIFDEEEIEYDYNLKHQRFTVPFELDCEKEVELKIYIEKNNKIHLFVALDIDINNQKNIYENLIKVQSDNLYSKFMIIENRLFSIYTIDELNAKKLSRSLFLKSMGSVLNDCNSLYELLL